MFPSRVKFIESSNAFKNQFNLSYVSYACKVNANFFTIAYNNIEYLRQLVWLNVILQNLYARSSSSKCWNEWIRIIRVMLKFNFQKHDECRQIPCGCVFTIEFFMIQSFNLNLCSIVFVLTHSFEVLMQTQKHPETKCI